MSEIPKELISYLFDRDRDRDERVTAVLEELEPAEQKLVSEAAVMGYVLGKQAPRDAKIPRDSDILWSVVAACLDMPDLYPAIGAPDAPTEETDHER